MPVPFVFVFFVFILVFITRYIGPEGPWQRLCRCLSQGNDGFFYLIFPTSDQLVFSDISDIVPQQR